MYVYKIYPMVYIALKLGRQVLGYNTALFAMVLLTVSSLVNYNHICMHWFLLGGVEQAAL